jgi:hypothetical protein
MNAARLLVLSLLASCAAAPAAAQAREVSVPTHPGLLGLTQTRAAASALGDLRAGSRAPDDVELRLWRGYGLTGTTGVVLRRTGGRWTGFAARMLECQLWVPATVADSFLPATVRRYQEIAKRDCGKPQPRVQLPALAITADSIAVRPLPAGAYLRQAWDEAMAAGVGSLPPGPPTARIALDGTGLVVELRRGNDYRASDFLFVRPAPSDADRRMQRVFGVVFRRLGLGGINTEGEW